MAMPAGCFSKVSKVSLTTANTLLMEDTGVASRSNWHCSDLFNKGPLSPVSGLSYTPLYGV